MATYQKRGDVWRALVRKQGLPPKSKSFPTKAMAKEWAERIEREYAARQARGEPEGQDTTLAQAIAWYVKEVGELTPFGRSKSADLARLSKYDLAAEPVLAIRTEDYIAHGQRRTRAGAGPATIGNDFVWLRQVLQSVRASLGLPVELQRLDDAVDELRRRKLVAKSKDRERRMTTDEESRLLAHFAERDGRAEIPMHMLMRFAVLTARRQEEITRLKWADLRPATSTAWLDDVKHPRQKIGNRREFRMLLDAWAIVDERRALAETEEPRSEHVFPYNPKSVGAAFTRACALLGIVDLHFHDLRHEATSRLFERGYDIPEVAQFTLHQSWATLKRYTHLKPSRVAER